MSLVNLSLVVFICWVVLLVLICFMIFILKDKVGDHLIDEAFKLNDVITIIHWTILIVLIMIEIGWLSV